MAQILSGKEVKGFYIEEMKKTVLSLFAKYNKKPCIACILVGENSASQIYVRNKEKLALKLGLESIILRLPEHTKESDLLNEIEKLNDDPDINGILVQLPLPKGINENRVILKIDPMKDVDVFHPQNIGALWTTHGVLAPCTPLAVINMLKYYELPIEGKRVVIVGRSNIVGKPLAGLFLKNNATVTVCHSRTENLKDICKEADILIAAIGKPKYITKDFVKKNAVVIDVGINRLEDGTVVGDVDFKNVEPISSAITPVPGGVGLMTVAMLMYNTVLLFKEQNRND